MGQTEQEIELRNLRGEVEALRLALDEEQAEVARLREENGNLALALSATNATLRRRIQDADLAEWAAELLTAFADRGTARPYTKAYTEALNRFWRLIENPPPTVLERLDASAIFWLRDQG